MTTLVSAYNSDGCIGRCDAKCQNATGPNCNCIYGGKNHGVGAQKAIENASTEWKEWVEAYQLQHEEQLHFKVNELALFQMSMF